MERQKVSSRVFQINQTVQQTVPFIYCLRKIGFRMDQNKPVHAYVISLSRDYEHTAEERVEQFFTACRNLLDKGERLETDHQCFRIVSDQFEILYCVELWRKNADKRGYVENGQVKIEMLHRMGCERAAYIFKKHRMEPLERMNEPALQEYKNPADRYAALAKSVAADIRRKSAQ